MMELKDYDEITLVDIVSEWRYRLHIERQTPGPHTLHTMGSEEEATQRLDSQPMCGASADLWTESDEPVAEAANHNTELASSNTTVVSRGTKRKLSFSEQEETKRSKVASETLSDVMHHSTVGHARSRGVKLSRDDSLLSGDTVKISSRDLLIKKRIGFGSCGEVMLAEWHQTPVAVKRIFRTLLHEDVLLEFKAEANMLKKLRHPNIVMLMGVCMAEEELCLVTQYMPRGSLRDVLNTTSLEYKVMLKMAIDAAKGMNYMHLFDPPIMHRDLKSHNLLVDENYGVKVTDFGLAKFHNEDKNMTFCGTLPWTAPEVFEAKGYTTKADVYSYGIVLWELWTRQEPYQGLNKAQIIIGVTQNTLRPALPDEASKKQMTAVESEYVALMTACWAHEPELRPSFAQILERLQGMLNAVEAREGSGTVSPAVNHATSSANHMTELMTSPQFMTQKFRETAVSVLKNNWEINGSELEFLEELKQSDKHMLYKGRYRGQDVCIKVLKDQTNNTQFKQFEQEFNVLAAVKGSHVTMFYGCVLRPLLCLVTEYVPYGSLLDLMTRATNLKFDWGVVITLATETATALNVLHQWRPQILHRDVKASNLLVDTHWIVKVADFGLARFNDTQNNSTLAKLRGTYLYSAPEVYAKHEYTTKSDVYSFGIVLWELVTKCMTGHYQRPYSEHQNLRYDFQIIIQTSQHNLRPTIPPNCPPMFVELMTKCKHNNSAGSVTQANIYLHLGWDADPDKRPSFQDIITALQKVKELYTKERSKKKEQQQNVN